MEPTGSPETSATTCHSMLRKIPEERVSHAHRYGMFSIQRKHAVIMAQSLSVASY
jgi:hypothetical protein